MQTVVSGEITCIISSECCASIFQKGGCFTASGKELPSDRVEKCSELCKNTQDCKDRLWDSQCSPKRERATYKCVREERFGGDPGEYFVASDCNVPFTGEHLYCDEG